MCIITYGFGVRRVDGLEMNSVNGATCVLIIFSTETFY